MNTVICDYCNKPAVLVSGDIVYPHRDDLYHKKFWLCEACKAYVGCHCPGSNPLGRLANAELRKAKKAAHAAFDPLWISKKFATRKLAYKWLANVLKIELNNCHIGMFDVETCQRAILACKRRSWVTGKRW